MDLDKKKNDVLVILNRQLNELLEIKYSNPRDLASEKLKRWSQRTAKIISENIGPQEEKNFLKTRPNRVVGSEREALALSCEIKHNYLTALINEVENYPEETLLDSTAENIQPPTNSSSQSSGNKVFVVHGHDERMKDQTENFLHRVSLEPIILHRQADKGRTIIEKFEKNSDVGYAIVLFTPDDFGGPIDKMCNSKFKPELRARQNVIFELGYIYGKLGRSKVCCLYKEGISLPSDIQGVIYKEIKEKIEEKEMEIIRELKSAGLNPKN